MTSLRISLLVLFNVVACTIIASETTNTSPIVVTVTVDAESSTEIVKYQINGDLPLYFVDKNNNKIKDPYTVTVQQRVDKTNTPISCLHVRYDYTNYAYASCLPAPKELLGAYQAVTECRESFDSRTLPFDSKIPNRTLPAVKLLEAIMLHIAQGKALGLKYNDQVLYQPSTSWLHTHKEAVSLCVAGCLGFALYCMFSQNTSNRLLAAPHK